MFEDLYRIQTAYYCCGIIVYRNRVVKAAPIAKWMEGKTFGQVTRWLKQRGGTIDRVPEFRGKAKEQLKR